MGADQRVKAIAEFTEKQANQLIQTHLEVNFEGSVFIHSQLGADPNGQIRLSSLTELTGTHEQEPGQMLFQVQQLVNEIRKQHPDMKMKDILNHCPIEWEGQQYPSLRAFLGLMADAGLQIEGYDQFGNRYPASILMEMTGIRLGLSGLAFKIFDPASHINFVRSIQTCGDPRYISTEYTHRHPDMVGNVR
jgi:hypothetical protein